MKTRIIILLTFLTIVSYSQTNNPLYEKSKEVLSCFEKGNFSDLSKYLDETMNKQLSAEKAKEVWNMLNQQAGLFIKSSTISDTTYQEYQIVYINCIFQNGILKMKTVFDKNGKVAGLFFVPENTPKP
jgi:hypothetical protein